MLPTLDVLVPIVCATVLAGVVRGFTGFGSALVFVPIASSVVEPWRAVILLFVIDSIAALPLAPSAIRHCTWHEVLPLSLGAAVTFPFGAHFLLSVDPTALRWGLSGLAFGVVMTLASGWRYQALPSRPLSAVVGVLSGFLGGLCGFYGPPIVIFWLAGQSRSNTVRANVIVFFATMIFVAGATYAVNGLFLLAVIYEALLLIPIFALSLWVGTKLFHRASEELFRHISYIIITGAAVSSAPIFDRNSD